MEYGVWVVAHLAVVLLEELDGGPVTEQDGILQKVGFRICRF